MLTHPTEPSLDGDHSLVEILIEIRPDLRGHPAPSLRGSALEVADVILVVRDNGDSPARAADELALTTAQVLTCVEYHELNPELVDERIEFCDFTRLKRDEPVDDAPRGPRIAGWLRRTRA